MIATDLPFTASTAQRLMKISADERLTKAAHVQALPPSWGTLYELTKLPDEVFNEKIADGTIHPEMQRQDVAGLVSKINRERKHQEIAKSATKQRIAGSLWNPFPLIYADPPWPYELQTGRKWSRKI